MRSAVVTNARYSTRTVLLRRNPPEAGDAEQAAPLDHRAARFGHRRDAELHAARDGLAIPRRSRAAVVLLPDAEPREVRLPPDVAHQHLDLGLQARKNAVLAPGGPSGASRRRPTPAGRRICACQPCLRRCAGRWASRIRRRLACNRRRRQSRTRTPSTWWPDARNSVTPGSTNGLSKGDVLGPADRAVPCREVLDLFGDVDHGGGAKRDVPLEARDRPRGT